MNRWQPLSWSMVTLEEAHRCEPEIIRSLYPNKDNPDQQERRRWELTAAHWDDVLNEVPLD